MDRVESGLPMEVSYSAGLHLLPSPVGAKNVKQRSGLIILIPKLADVTFLDEKSFYKQTDNAEKEMEKGTEKQILVET